MELGTGLSLIIFIFQKGSSGCSVEETARERGRQVEINVRTGARLCRQEVWALLSSCGTLVKCVNCPKPQLHL